MRRADIIITCDICDSAEYRQSKLDDGSLFSHWFDGPERRFLWAHVKGKDVCPRCRHRVETAGFFGITAEDLYKEGRDQ